MRLPSLTGSVAAALCACLAACSLAPTYRPPPAPAVTQYKEAGDWMPAQPADLQSQAAWWQPFDDVQLDALERTLADQNPDLHAALARFEQARALAQLARSNLWPTVDAAASATRARTSANGPAAAAGRGGSTGNDFVAELTLSWEIDLFGRLRNTASAASAQAQGSAADYAALALSLQAELASDYFALRGADTSTQLLENTIKTYDAAYAHTQARYERGAAAATDVDQAETQRQNARAQLAAAQLTRAQLEHAIAVLLGVLPADFSLPGGPLAAVPPAINAGLPSTLLQRRPDVASAERAVAAANARIGVARAAWFPVFTLGSAAAGFESVTTANWLTAPSRFWSVGPAARVPLLDAGARSATTRQAQGAYDEAVANYRKATLTAYQEVEDSLAALHHLADEFTADAAAAASAERAAHHADERYDAGVADYLEVTSTHAAALQAQQNAINARVASLNAAVTLVRATGGGWTATALNQAPPESR